MNATQQPVVLHTHPFLLIDIDSVSSQPTSGMPTLLKINPTSSEPPRNLPVPTVLYGTQGGSDRSDDRLRSCNRLFQSMPELPVASSSGASNAMRNSRNGSLPIAITSKILRLQQMAVPNSDVVANASLCSELKVERASSQKCHPAKLVQTVSEEISRELWCLRALLESTRDVLTRGESDDDVSSVSMTTEELAAAVVGQSNGSILQRWRRTPATGISTGRRLANIRSIGGTDHSSRFSSDVTNSSADPNTPTTPTSPVTDSLHRVPSVRRQTYRDAIAKRHVKQHEKQLQQVTVTRKIEATLKYVGIQFQSYFGNTFVFQK